MSLRPRGHLFDLGYLDINMISRGSLLCSEICMDKDRNIYGSVLMILGGHSFNLPRYQYNLTKKFCLFSEMYTFVSIVLSTSPPGQRPGGK